MERRPNRIDPDPVTTTVPIILSLAAETRLADLPAGSPEANAVALYLHATRYLEWATHLFGDRIDFNSQENYRDIELLITDPAIGDTQYITSPNRFLIASGSSVPVGLVAHEMGHRLFWIMEDQLAPVLAGPNDLVHCGILEYFTASFANDPFVPVGPPLLNRDVSLPVRYPEGLETIAQTADRFRRSYGTHFAEQPWHAQYAEFLSTLRGDAAKRLDGHRSGLVIAHPLWRARVRLGAAKLDALVVAALRRLPEIIFESRRRLPPTLTKNAPSKAQWFDLLAALLSVGEERSVFLEEFRRVGFDATAVAAAFPKVASENIIR